MAVVTAPRPLAENDDRATFDCGRQSMNQWFRRHAWTNHAAGISRVNVVCDTATGRIVGYVTLSAGQIERADRRGADERAVLVDLPAADELDRMAAAATEQREGHEATHAGELTDPLGHAIDIHLGVELVRAEMQVGAAREVDHHMCAHDRIVREVPHDDLERTRGMSRDAPRGPDQRDT